MHFLLFCARSFFFDAPFAGVFFLDVLFAGSVYFVLLISVSICLFFFSVDFSFYLILSKATIEPDKTCG
jgi:hypothetical protein